MSQFLYGAAPVTDPAGPGAIAMDHDGNIRMPFNTEGMYRGYIDTSGKEVVAIYKDE